MKTLGSGRQGYPRVIQLAHSGSANGQLIAATTGTAGAETVFRSTDGGGSFTQIGSIVNPGARPGQCCGSIFELPRQVGSMAAGTLLFAASYGQDRPPMSLQLFESTDHGAQWTKRSTIVTEPSSAKPGQGLWEPEMHIDSAGQLVVYYSDETQPGHSQALMERTSGDGVHWSSAQPVVELSAPSARPGMAVVSDLSDGHMFMTYELCGAGLPYGCAVYDRTSTDGIHWGDPSSPGNRILAADGDHFDNTPTTTVVRQGPDAGDILLVGHFYVSPTGQHLSSSGHTILVNAHQGAGAWTPITAPLSVATASVKCANYSSDLMPTDDGTHVLEIAQVPISANTCGARYATEALPR